MCKPFCAIIEKSRIVVGGLVCVARFVLGILNFATAAGNSAFVFTCPLVLLFGILFLSTCYCGMFFSNGPGTIVHNNGSRRGVRVASNEGYKK